MPPPKTTLDPFTELVTTQKLQHDEVMKEIAGIKSDLHDVRDGISLQLAEHNARIITLETFRQTKAADEKIRDWDQTTETVNQLLSEKRTQRVDNTVIWVERVQDRWKFVLSMWALVGGVVAAAGLWIFNNLVGPFLHSR